ncbi:HMA2 domain-containing protein [Methylocystis bryophila]|uniref:HMA domain-containing protein n=1 Tax=Methylocystis bryophila TaxID=655015 RepID=A0A1W6MZJ3_9HYPH|nr:hypothetical protein [Methylocystis bryophila]ARN82988.1 hypothetical protein B1812_20035 [Methylocystis bryophila]BDV39283.1 hypothetical protein DSM21852_25360 [Methylocystis bryophila]
MTIHLDPEKVRRGAVPSTFRGRPSVGVVLYVHHVPERLRVRLSILARNEPAAKLLNSELLAVAGVTSVSINSSTGSLLVHYDRGCFEPEAFWMVLRRLGYADPPQPAPFKAPKTSPSASPELANVVTEALVKAMLEQWLGRSAAALIGLLL